MKKISIRKADEDMANLIAYYSRKGQNYWNGSIVDLAKGNTERWRSSCRRLSAAICLRSKP